MPTLNLLFVHEDTTIPYTYKTYKRSKHIRLRVTPDGTLTVSAPPYVSQRTIQQYILDNLDWITSHLLKATQTLPPFLNRLTENDFKKHKNHAYALVTERIDFFNQHYNFKFTKLVIRDQKTRWGSCSKKGTLSFNYKILFLEPEKRDYIIVHELCHLREFNHSENFWSLVKQTIPDYKKIRRELKKRVTKED